MRTNSALVKAILQILLLGWSGSSNIVSGARILALFPMAAKSHFSCNEAMMRSLHDAGHQITFFSPFSEDASLKNYTTVDTKHDTYIYIGQTPIDDFNQLSFIQIMKIFLELEEKYCSDILNMKEIQNLLHSKEKEYDVMFIELLAMHDCFLPLAEKLNIPVIGTVTLRSWKLADSSIGNPNNPAVIPVELTGYSERMTFSQRVINVWKYVYLEYFREFLVSSRLNKIYEKFYASDLLYKKKISLVFYNNHLSLLPRPVAPNAIDVGGIHLKPAKPLPDDLRKFIDEAEFGVVLFSFGSVVKSSTMPSHMKIAFRDAFAEIPQRVIWKFEEPLENISQNVLLTKWMPQRDILAHKNIKVFISHCGMSGNYEAISEAVPMIFMPLFGDQKSNAALLEWHGVGVRLDFNSPTKEKILDALNAVVNDTRYGDAMRNLSKRFHDRPMSPQESIVFWTEYVVRHNGAPHLRTVGADLPIYQYLFFDVIVLYILIIVVCSYVIYKVLRWIYNLCFRNIKYCISIEINKKTS